MATIESRKSDDGEVHYRAKVRLKGFPTQTATFKRKTDAQRWAQSTEAAIREGRHFKTSESKKRTLADAINRYMEKVLPTKGKSPDNASNQKYQLEWWRDELGAYSLSEITPARLNMAREKLKEKRTHYKKVRSDATVNRYLSALSHVFTVAMKDWEWIDDTPFRKMRKLKESRGRVRFLSDEERDKLLEACKQSNNYYLYIIVMLALTTGARKGEILNMKWQDVDFNRKSIILHDTKNGERRAIRITTVTEPLLKELAGDSPNKDNYVFKSPTENKTIKLQGPWTIALERAGIQDFRFHDLRHTAASYLAMNGATSGEIAEILGHKTLEMVKRYAHLTESHTATVVESMVQKIFGGEE